ncbi:MAG: deoxyribodipyrimidine photo-lyase [Campylobacterales bacterium]|nr:deoxyribodipyrimidine photo-lyase [Campylobacterales bacterium]
MRRILWFRRDLRVRDNPLLSFEGEVLPLFIFDPAILDELSKDDKRMGFICHHVQHLKQELQERGLDLAIFYDTPKRVFETLAPLGFDEVVASGDFDTYAMARDREISHLLPFRLVKDTYVFNPDELLKKDGTPYLVFTPFYNAAKERFTPLHVKECVPATQTLFPYMYTAFDKDVLGFNAPTPTTLDPHYALERFALEHYLSARDFMAQEGTSRLGVHLRFGTLGVRELLRHLATQKKEGVNTEPFFRQLMFREFYAHLLFHFPSLETQNFRYSFQGVPDVALHQAFCEGKTGVPIVDAGVRELLQTGFMHNRVRMICTSFYTKHLLLPWQWGERFFAAHLLDYDRASNALSWQWSAGTGVDPQPYFRIFNPYTQSAKFDKDAVYITRFLPELRDTPAKTLHNEAALFESNHATYPKPIVKHKEAREKALAHFERLR